MKKKVITIACILLGIIAIIIGLFFVKKAEEKKHKIEILDATYVCAEALEKIYEDKEYTYYFPCVKSSSVYVKFENGTKTLVVDALNEKQVTIDELIDAGLDIIKKEK